jgi:cephalosporin-C deacetylase-like acetyl esterase
MPTHWIRDEVQPGDIAVFRDRKNGAVQNTGHVAFFRAMDEKKVEVLGGNQGGAGAGGGGVTVSEYPVRSAARELYGFISVRKLAPLPTES